MGTLVHSQGIEGNTTGVVPREYSDNTKGILGNRQGDNREILEECKGECWSILGKWGISRKY